MAKIFVYRRRTIERGGRPYKEEFVAVSPDGDILVSHYQFIGAAGEVLHPSFPFGLDSGPALEKYRKRFGDDIELVGEDDPDMAKIKAMVDPPSSDVEIEAEEPDLTMADLSEEEKPESPAVTGSALEEAESGTTSEDASPGDD